MVEEIGTRAFEQEFADYTLQFRNVNNARKICAEAQDFIEIQGYGIEHCYTTHPFHENVEQHIAKMIKLGKRWSAPPGSSVDAVLASLFMHPALQSGQLLH